MTKRILIDLTKFRSPFKGSCDQSPPEGLFYLTANSNGLKTLRELAVFQFTCRKCLDAPCIEACPADALEKDDNGVINRSTNLCVSCKSCVVICPFGTMMTDFFHHHRAKENYFKLTDENELQRFIEGCPEDAVKLVEMDEDPEKHIYKLNEHILIKEYSWDADIL